MIEESGPGPLGPRARATVGKQRVPGDIGLYRRMFDTLVANSTTDVDPILDRYVDMCYELARPRRG